MESQTGTVRSRQPLAAARLLGRSRQPLAAAQPMVHSRQPLAAARLLVRSRQPLAAALALGRSRQPLAAPARIAAALIVVALIVAGLTSCISLNPAYTEAGVYADLPWPLSLSLVDLHITNRNNRPTDSSHYLQYADTLLRQEGFSLETNGAYHLSIDLQEQSIINSLSGRLSVSGIATLYKQGADRILARVIYTAEQNRGFDSDPEIYRVLKILIRKLKGALADALQQK